MSALSIKPVSTSTAGMVVLCHSRRFLRSFAYIEFYQISKMN